MKVWVVESFVDYEGQALEGIFDSEKKAWEYINAFEVEKEKYIRLGYLEYRKQGGTSGSVYYDGMSCTEWDVL